MIVYLVLGTLFVLWLTDEIASSVWAESYPDQWSPQTKARFRKAFRAALRKKEREKPVRRKSKN